MSSQAVRRTTMRLTVVGAVVAAAIGFTASTAGAQGKRAEAERFFRAGEQAYGAGQYLVAAQAFEEALKLLPLPAIGFSTAQAYRLQYFIDKKPHNLKRAIDLYKNYIANVAKGGRRDDAAASLAELEPILLRMTQAGTTVGSVPVAAALTQLMVSTQVANAKATIDDKSGQAPLIREVSPGRHKVRVSAKGYFSIEQTATAVEGRLIVVEVKLKPKPALLALTTTDGARVTIDGRPVGLAPFPKPLALAAGKHVVVISARGREAKIREISVERGQRLSMHAPLRRTAQRKASYWVLAAAGTTLVASGVVAGFAFAANSDAQDLNDRRTSMGLTTAQLADYTDAVDRRRDHTRTSLVLLGVGAALGVTGSLMYFFDNPRPEAPNAPSADSAPDEPAEQRSPFAVAPIVGDGLAGLSARIEF